MFSDDSPATFDEMTKLLAAAMLAGPFDELSLNARTANIFHQRPRWLRGLNRRVFNAFGTQRRPARRKLVGYLRADRRLIENWENNPKPIRSCRIKPEFAPANARSEQWQAPPIHTVGDLADWLELDTGQLDWFADRKQLGRYHSAGPLCHYLYEWRRKRGGSVRLIEAPKSRLKSIQRRVLSEILSKIPVHNAAHGFRPQRSIRTFSEPHIGKTVVLKMDLQDFFPSIPPARLISLLMTAGYTEEVARTITGLCTNCAPYGLWQSFPASQNPDLRWQCRQLYHGAHFPQGAPTSPAIANLCTFRLDQRLAGLARVAGAAYTRYADDLLFSGDREFARGIESFRIQAASIVLMEGLQVNHHKTRAMYQSQRQYAAGIILNDRPNIPREDFDRLKAILHQSVLQGPRSQNRDELPDFRAHLRGRIQWVMQLNPARGQKLATLFDAIDWPENG
jgi:RNA-directed DNA polymerase